MNKPIQVFDTAKWGFKCVLYPLGLLSLSYLIPGLKKVLTYLIINSKSSDYVQYAEAINEANFTINFFTITLLVLLLCLAILDYSIIVYGDRIETQPMLSLFGTSKLYFKDIKYFEVNEYTQTFRGHTDEVKDLNFVLKNGKKIILRTFYHKNECKLREILSELLHDKM